MESSCLVFVPSQLLEPARASLRRAASERLKEVFPNAALEYADYRDASSAEAMIKDGLSKGKRIAFGGVHSREVPSLFAVDGYYPKLDKVLATLQIPDSDGLCCLWVTDGIPPSDKSEWKVPVRYIPVNAGDYHDESTALRLGVALGGGTTKWIGIGLVALLVVGLVIGLAVGLSPAPGGGMSNVTNSSVPSPQPSPLPPSAPSPRPSPLPPSVPSPQPSPTPSSTTTPIPLPSNPAPGT